MVSGVSDVNCKFSALNVSLIPNETLITGGHSTARAKLEPAHQRGWADSASRRGGLVRLKPKARS